MINIASKIKKLNFISLGIYSTVAIGLVVYSNLHNQPWYNQIAGLLFSLPFLKDGIMNHMKLCKSLNNLKFDSGLNFLSSFVHTKLFINNLNDCESKELKKAKIIFLSIWINSKKSDNGVVISSLLKHKLNHIIKKSFDEIYNFDTFFQMVGYRFLREDVFKTIDITDQIRDEYYKSFNQIPILIDNLFINSHFSFCMQMQKNKLLPVDIEKIKLLCHSTSIKSYFINDEIKQSLTDLIMNNIEHIEIMQKLLQKSLHFYEHKDKSDFYDLLSLCEKCRLYHNLSNNTFAKNDNEKNIKI